MDPLVKLIIFIVTAFLLLKLPIIGRYIAVINTLIHEVGHALASKLTFGEVDRIELFSNTEGTAWSSNRFWIGRVLTSLAGYPTASATGFLLLYLIYNQKYLYSLIILLGILIFGFVFWIRNLYGLFWVMSFSSLIIWIVIYDNAILTESILLLITSIIFVESITSAFTIFRLSITQPGNAGDATSMWKSIIFIPPQIWGFLFFLQSLFFGYLGVSLYM